MSWLTGQSRLTVPPVVPYLIKNSMRAEDIRLWEKDRTISLENPTEKECVLCNRVLPVEFFSSSKRRKDGLSSVCKECFSKRQNAYIIKWAEEHQNKKEDTFSLFPDFEKICNKCKIIRRKGVVRVICDNPKHKQRQG